MGPGTNVINNIMTGKKPLHHNDMVAALHDIDYLSGGDMYEQDLKAIINSDYTLSGFALKLGLSTRMLLDFILKPLPVAQQLVRFNGQDQYSADETIQIQTFLRQKLLADNS
jgi:hypothetical protein